MGVPRFFRWLANKYPFILSQEVNDKNNNRVEFDNLYLDMNGIIHNSSHDDSTVLEAALPIETIIANVCNYLDNLVVNVVRPTKSLFIAVDGVAPRAKLNQQRSRRFKTAFEYESLVAAKVNPPKPKKYNNRRNNNNSSAAAAGAANDSPVAEVNAATEGNTEFIPPTAIDATPPPVSAEAVVASTELSVQPTNASDHFDSNCITPGTEFMLLISHHLKLFIQSRMESSDAWRGLQVYYSGPEVFGEGEHKIVSFIRQRRYEGLIEPNERHCMNGQDADMIMLALTTHEKYFHILREVVDPASFSRSRRRKPNKGGKGKAKPLVHKAKFQYLRINVLRECMFDEFIAAAEGEEGEAAVVASLDMERIVDDFVFLTFFVGNDFLPTIPSLSIRDNALELIIAAYRESSHESSEYLLSQGKLVNFSRLRKMVSLLSLFESSHSRIDFSISKKKSERMMDSMAMQAQTETDAVVATLLADPDYMAYREAFYQQKFGLNIATEDGRVELKRLVFDYLQGLVWCLSYYAQGCVSWKWFYPHHYGPLLIDLAMCSGEEDFYSFALSKPFTPFQQLLSCLPSQSAGLLPESYRELMVDPSSPLIDYYPKQLKFDFNGSKKLHEAVLLLNFIDEDNLKESERNYHCLERCSPEEQLRNDFTSMLLYRCDGAAGVSATEIAVTISPCPQSFESKLLGGTAVKLSGFPGLKELSQSATKQTQQLPTDSCIQISVLPALDPLLVALGIQLKAADSSFIPSSDMGKSFCVPLVTDLGSSSLTVNDIQAVHFPTITQAYKPLTLKVSGVCSVMEGEDRYDNVELLLTDPDGRVTAIRNTLQQVFHSGDGDEGDEVTSLGLLLGKISFKNDNHRRNFLSAVEELLPRAMGEGLTELTFEALCLADDVFVSPRLSSVFQGSL